MRSRVGAGPPRGRHSRAPALRPPTWCGRMAPALRPGRGHPVRQMRILMLLVRNPGGPDSGRKRAIRSVLGSLTDLGHTVHVVAVSEEAADPDLPDGVTFQTLPPPHVGRVVANVVRYGMTARLSLNECLCWSRHLAQALKRIADSEK